MKIRSKIVTAIFTTTIIVILGFKINHEIKSNTAEVNQIQGLYIFVDSKPLSDYEYLGTEQVVISLGTGQYRDIRDKLIKKVKKEYPNANGIIFYFNDGSADKADAIKIK